MKYRVESNDDEEPSGIAIDYLGSNLSEARAVARQLSNYAQKHNNYDGIYIVAMDGDEDVGQIVYYYGRTSYTEGRVK